MEHVVVKKEWSRFNSMDRLALFALAIIIMAVAKSWAIS